MRNITYKQNHGAVVCNSGNTIQPINTYRWLDSQSKGSVTEYGHRLENLSLTAWPDASVLVHSLEENSERIFGADIQAQRLLH